MVCNQAQCLLSVITQSGRSSHQHTIKVLSQADCSVQEVNFAVRDVVEFDSVKSASRMNSVTVFLLISFKKVENVVAGTVLCNTFTPLDPLVNPSKIVTIFKAGLGSGLVDISC